MNWYRYALRKHLMRFDPRIILETSIADANLDALLTSFIGSAIIKGLDIAGFVSIDPQVPIKAVQLSRAQNVDLFILPGQIYHTEDEYKTIIYNKPEKYPDGLSLEKILQDCQKNNWPTLVYDLGKQKAGSLLKMGESTGLKPTFVEIFNGKSYGYAYLPTNTYEVVSSAATTPKELEATNIYSHVGRKDMEKLQIIPEKYGEDYVPPYLEPSVPAQPAPTQENI